MSSGVGSRHVAAWLVVVVLIVAMGPAASADSLAAGDPTPVREQVVTSPPPGETTATANETTTPSENGTPHLHANPATVEAEQTAPELEAHLSRQLSRRLTLSVDNLSRQEYETAVQLLGDEHAADLARYEAVATQLDGEAAAEQYRELSDEQREYVSSIRRLQELGEAYRAAKREGDGERARRLARNVSSLAADVSANTTALRESYTDLANATDADFGVTKAQLEQLQENVTLAAERVRQQEFEATTLTVESNATTVSFRRPVRLRGRLTAADGEPVPNRVVTLRVGPTERTVETSPTGAFELTYRPVQLSAAAAQLSVTYLPSADSLYRRSSDAVRIDVTQVTARVDDLTTPTNASYDDAVAVHGTVTVDGRPVPTLPVSVRVGEVTLASTTTATNGTFDVAPTLPARVDDRDHDLELRGRADRAVTLAETRRPLPVLPTPTTVSATIANRTDSAVVVTGTLETDDGGTLADRPVQVLVGDRTLASTTTAANGSYRTTVSLADVTENTLTVTFPGGYDTSLAAARTQVALGRGLSPLGTVGGALAGVALVGGIIWAVRRRQAEIAAENGSEAVSEPTDPMSSTPPAVEADESADPEAVLTEARAALDAGDPERAVTTAYGAAWQRLRARTDATATTHWQLYTQSVDAGVGDAAALESLTELYEQAAYDRTAIASDDAAQALTLCERLLDATADDRGGTSP